jgi:hypothetical protein
MRNFTLGIAVLTVSLILSSGKAQAQARALTPEEIAQLKLQVDASVQRIAQLQYDAPLSRNQTAYQRKQQEIDDAKKDLGQTLLKIPEMQAIDQQLQRIAEMERVAAQSQYRGNQRGNLADYQRQLREIKQMKEDVNDSIRALPASLPLPITQDVLQMALGGIGFQKTSDVNPGDLATAAQIVTTTELGKNQIGKLDQEGARSSTIADYQNKQQNSNQTVQQFQRDLALKLDALRTAQNNAERSRMHPGSPNP